ncbi:swr1 complex component [Cryomyces antarcticus]|nr:swr1 complex component [Cryomyces antarcticus]
MNFAKGILESRKQTYRSLKNVLKAIPLETPTLIELSPGKSIRVTLFDANHCTGAVMFLIQGDGKAILYTGDIRSEAWWVDSLIRNPILIPYTKGSQRLDTVYLDTTYALDSAPYRSFPSKADGLKELLDKVSHYPEETVFYLESWTFGYEDVWVALAAFFNTRVHLDRYRRSLYKSLSGVDSRLLSREVPALCGSDVGNHYQAGCLTSDPSVRLHSCERGTPCWIHSHDCVRITPIISRLDNGVELPELGAGGGKGDLSQMPELEISDLNAVEQLMDFVAERLDDSVNTATVVGLLQGAAGQRNIKLDTTTLKDRDSVHHRDQAAECKLLLDELPLEDLAGLLLDAARDVKNTGSSAVVGKPCQRELEVPKNPTKDLPREITFPYSRHSSYDELRMLVRAFKPKDIYPCTVDEHQWSFEVSMETLFGDLCSTDTFRHDEEMLDRRGHRDRNKQRLKRMREDVRRTIAEPQAKPAPKRPTEDISHSVVEPCAKIARLDLTGPAPPGESRRSNTPWSDKNTARSESMDKEELRWRRRLYNQFRWIRAMHSQLEFEKLSNSHPHVACFPGAPRLGPGESGRLALAALQTSLLEDISAKNGTDPPRSLQNVPARSQPPLHHNPKADYLRPRTGPSIITARSVSLNTALRTPAVPAYGETVLSAHDRDSDGGKPQPQTTRGDTSATDAFLEDVSQDLWQRQRAYYAALGLDGASWDDVGLVSVNGHQEKELELGEI